jgi:hypothetical protein
METACKCGEPISRVEVRVVQRCTRGHYVTSSVAPAILKAAGPEPASAGQLRAFHAKCGTLDKKRDLPTGTTKQQLLVEGGWASSRDIDSLRMTDVLDRLDTYTLAP